MEIDEYRAHQKTVSTEHGSIGYTDVGDGPPALFVHGIFLNGFLWRRAIGQLAGERRCLAIDLPAHGQTETKADLDFGLPTQAEVLRGFCDALELEDIDLVANDTGGAVAQVFAARWPERVRTLALTNCDAHDNLPPEAFNGGLEAARNGDLAPLMVEMSRNLDLARGEEFGFGLGYEHPERLSDDEVRVYTERFADLSAAREVERFTNALDASDLLAVEPQLRQLKAPTLIVWGTGDIFFEVDWAYWLRDAIPGAEDVVEIDGGKLFFPDERAEELAHHLSRYWAAYSPSASASGQGRAPR
jgi:pimeloyl-ACP methyl ester carboxylesterase